MPLLCCGQVARTHPVQVQGGVHKRDQLVKAVHILLRVVLCRIEQQRVLQAVVCVKLVVEGGGGLAIQLLVQAAAAAERSCNVLEPERHQQQQQWRQLQACRSAGGTSAEGQALPVWWHATGRPLRCSQQQ